MENHPDNFSIADFNRCYKPVSEHAEDAQHFLNYDLRDCLNKMVQLVIQLRGAAPGYGDALDIDGAEDCLYEELCELFHSEIQACKRVIREEGVEPVMYAPISTRERIEAERQRLIVERTRANAKNMGRIVTNPQTFGGAF